MVGGPGKPTESANSGQMGCFLAVGLLVVIVVGCTALGGGDDDSPSATDLKAGAFDVCTQFVEDRLKAPGTAKFRNYFQDDGEVIVTGIGEGPYTVRSSVDAQNGFGAEIRTDFVCTVNHTGDGNWRLANLSLDE